MVQTTTATTTSGAISKADGLKVGEVVAVPAKAYPAPQNDVTSSLAPGRIYMFPFAGDGGNGYGPLLPPRLDPERIRFTQLSLPGHGERLNEALLSSLPDMARDLFHRIAPDLRGADVFYGHSMGALLALAVARQARAMMFPLPRALIVSGMRGPARLQLRARHRLPREELRDELRRLGGSPAEVLGNEGVFDFFEPLIRSDFAAVETYRHVVEPPLPIPIIVLAGEQDDATNGDLREWQSETTRPITVRALPGGHFFIYKHPETIRSLLLQTLTERVVEQPGMV